MNNKRKFLRVPARVDFLVADDGTLETGDLYFPSRNVSLGGAFLVSDFLLQAGTVIQVRFDLPGEPRVEAEAKVVRVSESEDDDPGMGIEFTLISRESLAAIKRFLEKNARSR
jgi:hypothetical protein